MRKLLIAVALIGGALGMSACTVPTVPGSPLSGQMSGQCVVYGFGEGAGIVTFNGPCSAAYQYAQQNGGTVAQP